MTLFGLSLGNTKSWAKDNAYLAALDPDFVVLDARTFTPDDARRWTRRLDQLGLARLIDPVNYFDQSPLNNGRPPFYKRLPYGNGARIVVGGAGRLANDTHRRSYLNPIVSYQRQRGVTTVIAPYFYAGLGDSSLIEESLRLGRLTAQVVTGSPDPVDTWTGLAVVENWLRTANRPALLNLLTAHPAETLYLMVNTTQASSQPLGDIEVLEGILEVNRHQKQAGGRLIVGRRYSSGLLLGALGVDGWTTGYEGERQNFSPPPEKETTTGGRARDWVYNPKLLNSLLLQTRNSLHPNHRTTFAPADAYETAVFTANPTPATLTRDQRRLLHRHDIFSLRQQTRSLSAGPAAAQKAAMRGLVVAAGTEYAAMTWPWDPSEAPTFLASWQTLV